MKAMQQLARKSDVKQRPSSLERKVNTCSLFQEILEQSRHRRVTKNK